MRDVLRLHLSLSVLTYRWWGNCHSLLASSQRSLESSWKERRLPHAMGPMISKKILYCKQWSSIWRITWRLIDISNNGNEIYNNHWELLILIFYLSITCSFKDLWWVFYRRSTAIRVTKYLSLKGDGILKMSIFPGMGILHMIIIQLSCFHLSV